MARDQPSLGKVRITYPCATVTILSEDKTARTPCSWTAATRSRYARLREQPYKRSVNNVRCSLHALLPAPKLRFAESGAHIRRSRCSHRPKSPGPSYETRKYCWVVPGAASAAPGPVERGAGAPLAGMRPWNRPSARRHRPYARLRGQIPKGPSSELRRA
jgi:hypothetical protein